jgi:Ca-activated chloride channel family protein
MDRTLFTLALILPVTAVAQGLHLEPPPRPLLPDHVVPQTRRIPAAGAGRVQVTGVTVAVEIVDQLATTVMDIALRNPTPARLESELVMPVPSRTVVRGFRYQGTALEAKLEVLPADAARRVYDATVQRQRDPGLLEFIGHDLVRSSVFPVEPGAEQKVRLVYEHLLPCEGSRVDYLIPRTESLEYRVPWAITVRLRSRRPISTVYSPSHPFRSVGAASGEIVLQLEPAAAATPGPVRLSYVLGGEDMGAAFFAYPETAGEPGYFLVVAGAPSRRAGPAAVPRELTVVLDRSGSMQGAKWAQTTGAAQETLRSLRPDERFNVVLYNHEVEAFAPAPVPVSAANVERALAWIGDHGPRGGTNIHGALEVALAQPTAVGALPLVLFVTDGLPTVGETREGSIVQLAGGSNRAGRRIFTFGIGTDVNAPLLERVASESRATATFVLPGDGVRDRTQGVLRRLGMPVLASPEVKALGAVEDLFPARLPDLFAADQLVLVGRFRGPGRSSSR